MGLEMIENSDLSALAPSRIGHRCFVDDSYFSNFSIGHKGPDNPASNQIWLSLKAQYPASTNDDYDTVKAQIDKLNALQIQWQNQLTQAQQQKNQTGTGGIFSKIAAQAPIQNTINDLNNKLEAVRNLINDYNNVLDKIPHISAQALAAPDTTAQDTQTLASSISQINSQLGLNKTAPSTSGMSTLAIVGIVGGVVLIGGLAIFMIKRKRAA